MRWTAAVVGVWLSGCAADEPAEPSPYGCGNGLDTDLQFDTNGRDVDNDGDGLTELEGDCDDNNCNVHPFAEDVNNGVDANCDGDREPLYGCGVTAYDNPGGDARRASSFPWLLLSAMILGRRATRSRRGVDGATS